MGIIKEHPQKSTIHKYHSLFVEQTKIINKEKDDRIILIALFTYHGGALASPYEHH